MGTRATIKIEGPTQVRRLTVAHDGDRLNPTINRALEHGSTVDEVFDALVSAITRDIYGGQLRTPYYIREITKEESRNWPADVRWRITLGDLPRVTSTLDFV